MNKRVIPFLSVIMTFSFLILVGLQFYFLREVLRKSNEDFTSKVKFALNSSSEKMQNKEISSYYKLFGNFYKQVVDNKDVTTKRIIQSVVDSGDYRYITFQNYVIEKKSIPIPLSQDTLESTQLRTDGGTLKIERSDESEQVEQLTQKLENSIDDASLSIKNFARINFSTKPINQRVNTIDLRKAIQKELQLRDIDAPFFIGVLNNRLQSTDVKEKDFKMSAKNNFTSVLFNDNEDKPAYYVSVYFPAKNFSVLKPFFAPIAVTLLTSLIVIGIYILSLYYIRKQKLISEIKTDFINNMSHEFKTPIATINIATDALKNKNVIKDETKITYYANLIKSENVRMNKQVEMILRMSKIERNQLEFNPETKLITPIIKKAIESLKIVVENRNGIIIEDLDTDEVTLQVDEFHLVNSLVNLLDNANKYSPENPQITIKSYTDDHYCYISVKDQGVGMKSGNIKKIFEKFYREETGNIHNVKGHGLGLTYVKKIADLHLGDIQVESKENQGSTFTLQLPLNNKI